MLKQSRKIHKWLMLFIGIQLLLWTISGVYMVVADIHYVHGDSLVKNQHEEIDSSKIKYSFAQLVTDYPSAKQIELRQVLGNPSYRFYDNQNVIWLSASTGKPLDLLSQEQAQQIAAEQFNSANVEILNTQLLTQQVPFELSPRHLPVWRVDFAGWNNPTLYIQANSGQVVTKRHDIWRLFDLMWRLHIMDYTTGEDVNNLLLRVISVLGLIAAIAGTIMAYTRNKKARKVENVQEREVNT